MLHHALQEYILEQSDTANKQVYQLALQQALADKKTTKDEQANLDTLKKTPQNHKRITPPDEKFL